MASFMQWIAIMFAAGLGVAVILYLLDKYKKKEK